MFKEDADLFVGRSRRDCRPGCRRRHQPRATLPASRRGTALPVVERILNHIGGSFAGVAGIYMKFEFSDEKREALAKLGEYCERLTVSPHQPAVTVDRNFRGASTVRRISKLLPVPRIVTLP
jgi:hypothetical protein